MKAILTLSALAIVTTASPAFARGGGHYGGYRSSGGVHYTAPHVTRSGTLVQGHMSTNPNRTRNDNFSTRYNVNPYTGKVGTVDPFAPKLPRRSRSRW